MSSIVDSAAAAAAAASSSAATNEWQIGRTLGEGTFAVVKLALNKNTKEAMAVKFIQNCKDNEDDIKKEIAVHKIVKHENIVKYFAHRSDNGSYFIFLEYICGGELFDYIKPNCGMDILKANVYFHQLIKALEYIHSMGIVHRDVKPENCLLSSNNQIKLTDFGFATIYRYKGKERLLDRVCGTYPYMAPELFKKLPHSGEPLDVWSAGITYIALITGQLCWQKATIECDLYRNYLTKIYKIKQPWVSIEHNLLKEIRQMLKCDPKKRTNFHKLLKSQLLFGELENSDVKNCKPSTQRFRVMRIDENYKRSMIKIGDTSPTCSQPPVKRTKRNIFSQSSVDNFQSDLPDVSKDDSSESAESANDFVIDLTSPNNYWSLSQPLETFAHKSILSSTLSPPNSASSHSVYSQANEDLLSQMTQSDNSDDIVDISGLPNRMSRIFFTNNIETISRALRDIISFYNAKITDIINNSIRATQQLSNSNKLDIMIIFIRVKHNVVLCEFRRINGCGLQFRKLFRQIRNSFKSICI